MIQKQLRYDENNDPWMEIFDEGGTLDRYFFDGYIVHITPYGEEIETLEEYCVGRTPMECRAAFELAAESIFNKIRGGEDEYHNNL